MTQNNFICTIKELPKEALTAAATKAIEVNPANAPSAHLLSLAPADLEIPKEFPHRKR